jgi:hypothetical protein
MAYNLQSEPSFSNPFSKPFGHPIGANQSIMNATSTRIAFSLLAIVTVSLGLVLSPSLAQQAGPSRTAGTVGVDAQREQIWNSAAMLRARAWVAEYCERSAKISPEEGKKYMAELEGLSPGQMKLWLLKFEHDHEQQQQRTAVWQKAHQSALSHAMAADKAAQASMANIAQGETGAAQQEQGQLNTQQAEANEAQQDKMSDLNADGAPGGWGYGGYGGYGGYHIHYHLSPY